MVSENLKMELLKKFGAVENLCFVHAFLPMLNDEQLDRMTVGGKRKIDEVVKSALGSASATSYIMGSVRVICRLSCATLCSRIC